MQSLNFMSIFCVWTSVILFVWMWNMPGRKPFWICSSALRGFVLCNSYGFLKLKCNQETSFLSFAKFIQTIECRRGTGVGTLSMSFANSYDNSVSQDDALQKSYSRNEESHIHCGNLSQECHIVTLNFGLYFSFVLYHQFWNDKWILHVEINTNISSIKNFGAQFNVLKIPKR
jgi:hypothetical protein